MKKDYQFTANQILFKLQNWTLESLNKKEKIKILDALIKQQIFNYSLNDVESLILELISED